MTRLAILGPGLLGGSVAGAVRRAGMAEEIRVWARRRAAGDAVVAKGWADFASDDVAAVVEGADVVVLATPVGVMPALAKQIVAAKARMSPDVLITDVGSVKGMVAESVAPIFDAAGLTFIGSHPMAGAETAGFEAARDDLFDGAACILTPHAASLPRLRAFWERLGCRLFVMTPEEHDAAVARVSHLPHVAASALVLAVLSNDGAVAAVAGGGFRDTTRVASGDAALWTEILLENRLALEAPIEDLRRRLAEVSECLRHGDSVRLHELLDHAKRMRDRALTSSEAPPHG